MNIDAVKDRIREKINITPTCWLWTGSCNKHGYAKTQLGTLKDKTRRTVAVHRLIYQLYKGVIDEGLFVCHTCDVRNCVNPDHLFLGSPKDNTLDMVKKGRAGGPPKGERHPNSKLSDEERCIIKDLYGKGVWQKEIRKRFGVSQATISRTVNA